MSSSFSYSSLAAAGPGPAQILIKDSLPEIHLLCMNDSDTTAFTAAVAKHHPDLPSLTEITHHNCALKYVPQDVQFDAVVSPANSYARLDGAFDDALARAYGPPGDYGWITRKAQAVVYDRWRGFAPPGTCTVVPLDHEGQFSSPPLGRRDAEPLNAWGTKYLLLCPTMRVPQNVEWDKEVVYECIWSLLCAVDNHNRDVRQREAEEPRPARSTGRVQVQHAEIKSVLMTPLATGAGYVSPKRWAEQCVLAMKHWVAAVEKPEVWSKVGWGEAYRQHYEVAATYKTALR
ncbi:hypothetical protein LTR53_002783 [Teratosphaeriaceae sp. CCFEE 6253]|nr:hypothetical protein LTR53_002783 [Teratosphaeriaceae sp. CCFEE 6253]